MFKFMVKPDVKRSLIELSREFGNVLPVEQLFEANPEISREEIMTALDELKGEGFITEIDNDSIQVNM